MSVTPCTVNSLPKTIDIFCRVIDNFGDAGVLWRLAREMRREGFLVRFIIDDTATLALLAGKTRQTAPEEISDDKGLKVIRWEEAWGAGPCPLAVSDMVIEGFACRLPPDYENRIRPHETLWINIDYFTAEDWIEGCHGLKSILPSTGAEKINYFPGVSRASGGLTIEKGYEKVRQAFLSQKKATRALAVFYFSYPTAPVNDLAALFARSPIDIALTCSACEAAQTLAEAVSKLQSDKVTVEKLHFVPQENFDCLLWGADITFVRGEDSAARAMLAGVPFIWHIYPQEDGAHWVKLDALVEKMRPVFEHREVFEAWARFQRSFNAGIIDSNAWAVMIQELSALKEGFERWGEHVRGNDNIALCLSQMLQKR